MTSQSEDLLLWDWIAAFATMTGLECKTGRLFYCLREITVRKMLLTYIPLIILLPIVGLFFYYWLTLIHETTTSGTAYGFTIGDDKHTTYSKAYKNLKKLSTSRYNRIYISVVADESMASRIGVRVGDSFITQTRLDVVAYANFEKRDFWKFYLEEPFSNSLKLKFCDDKLCEIYRHRQYFELP